MSNDKLTARREQFEKLIGGVPETAIFDEENGCYQYAICDSWLADKWQQFNLDADYYEAQLALAKSRESHTAKTAEDERKYIAAHHKKELDAKDAIIAEHVAEIARLNAGWHEANVAILNLKQSSTTANLIEPAQMLAVLREIREPSLKAVRAFNLEVRKPCELKVIFAVRAYQAMIDVLIAAELEKLK